MESILKPRAAAHSVHANVPNSKTSRRAGAVMTGIATLSATLFPIYIGILLWGGIVLREERLRAILPLRL